MMADMKELIEDALQDSISSLRAQIESIKNAAERTEKAVRSVERAITTKINEVSHCAYLLVPLLDRAAQSVLILSCLICVPWLVVDTFPLDSSTFHSKVSTPRSANRWK